MVGTPQVVGVVCCSQVLTCRLHLQEVVASLHRDLSLGVLGHPDLDPMVAQYIRSQLALSAPIQLYFTEPHAKNISRKQGVTGIVNSNSMVPSRCSSDQSRMPTAGAMKMKHQGMKVK